MPKYRSVRRHPSWRRNPRVRTRGQTLAGVATAAASVSATSKECGARAAELSHRKTASGPGGGRSSWARAYRRFT
jgi:hypothetical protein